MFVYVIVHVVAADRVVSVAADVAVLVLVLLALAVIVAGAGLLR